MKIRLNNRKEASNSSEFSTYSNKTVELRGASGGGQPIMRIY